MAKKIANGLPGRRELLDLAKSIPPTEHWRTPMSAELNAAKEAVDERRKKLLSDPTYRKLVREAARIERRDKLTNDRKAAARTKLIQRVRLEGPTAANVKAVKKALGL